MSLPLPVLPLRLLPLRVRPVLLAALLAVLLGWGLLAPAHAEDAQPGDRVSWIKDLPFAFEQAKVKQKILMICVNAKRVDGRTRDEPAAKGLREVVYKDVRVVGKSRDFVCAFLTPEGSSEDYGELRALGIDGEIVSPQHIFVHPNGDAILLQTRYWSHGKGEAGVQALLDLMDEAAAALAATAAKGDDAAAGATEAGAPPPVASPERLPWIQAQVETVLEGGEAERRAALQALVTSDVEGDCTRLLIGHLEEGTKDVPRLIDLIRALGRDGLVDAAPPIAEYLTHKEALVRGNAAVSLEYIGRGDKKVLAALRKAADKEKEASLANHMYRALGRCGVGQAKVRALLLKKSDSAKSEFASYGPTIGLAYFEGDAKAARGVEKILKKIGVPGSRRGGGQNTVKRGLLSWTLASIGDAKSARFMREELIARLENVRAFWVDGLVRFYDAVAIKCEGDASAMVGIEAGVGIFVNFAKEADLGRYGAETRGLMDECRVGREAAGFEPKGDGLLGGRE